MKKKNRRLLIFIEAELLEVKFWLQKKMSSENVDMD